MCGRGSWCVFVVLCVMMGCWYGVVMVVFFCCCFWVVGFVWWWGSYLFVFIVGCLCFVGGGIAFIIV